MTSVTADKVVSFRLARHRLDKRARAGSALDVAGALCGLHAQLASSAELSLWARVEGIRRGEVRDALEERRSLVKTWAMRGTLHLLPAADLPLYTAVLQAHSPHRSGAWLRGHGITAEHFEAILEGVPRVLAGRPLTREELADELGRQAGPEVRERLLSGWGALLKPSARRGDLCFGPNRGRNVTFVRPDTWLGPLPEVETHEAKRELLRRYLAAYGPATHDGFARWFGLRSGARRFFDALADELDAVDVDGKSAHVLATDIGELRKPRRRWSVRLLPGFDPYVVGFRPREHLAPARELARIFRPQGWISPVVLVDGTAAGVWTHERRGKRIRLEIELFAPVSRSAALVLAEEADRLGDFLGAPAEVSFA